jgi:hypothetical protein
MVRFLASQTMTLVWVLHLNYLLIIYRLPPSSKRQHVVVIMQHEILQMPFTHLLFRQFYNRLIFLFLFDDTLPSDSGGVNA